MPKSTKTIHVHNKVNIIAIPDQNVIYLYLEETGEMVALTPELAYNMAPGLQQYARLAGQRDSGPDSDGKLNRADPSLFYHPALSEPSSALLIDIDQLSRN